MEIMLHFSCMILQVRLTKVQDTVIDMTFLVSSVVSSTHLYDRKL